MTQEQQEEALALLRMCKYALGLMFGPCWRPDLTAQLDMFCDETAHLPCDEAAARTRIWRRLCRDISRRSGLDTWLEAP